MMEDGNQIEEEIRETFESFPQKILYVPYDVTLNRTLSYVFITSTVLLSAVIIGMIFIGK